MSDFSRLLLAIFLGVFVGGALNLGFPALRRSLKSRQYPIEVVTEINERALTEVMKICTPVFLGICHCA